MEAAPFIIVCLFSPPFLATVRSKLAQRLRRWSSLDLTVEYYRPLDALILFCVAQPPSGCCQTGAVSVHLTKGGGPRVVVSTAAFHARVRGSVPGLGGLRETQMFLPHPRVKVSIVGSLRDREVACSASDRQGSNFESCVWRTVSSQSSHHTQEVLLAQFSLYVHKGGLKPDSFHFISPLTKDTERCCLKIYIYSLICTGLPLNNERVAQSPR